MSRKALESDREKLEAAIKAGAISNMTLLPNDEVLLSRFIATLGEVLLPALEHPIIVVHLGGNKATGQSSADFLSTPSITTIVPPSEAAPFQFHGNFDGVTMLLSGNVKQRLIENISGDQPVSFADAIIPAIARQLASESARSKSERRGSRYYNSLTDALLEHLCHLLKDGQDQQLDSNSVHSTAIQNALDFIHQNLRSSLTIAELAETTGLHPSWFRQLFKQVTGMTVRQYIIRRRLERARDLLANTDIALLKLADETGFCSQSHFSDCFKKTYGTTPSQYRKLL